MLQHGTTTIEAKSGYGLTLEDEIKCLEAAKNLNKSSPIDIVSTFLGAHAVPPEYKGKTDEYVSLITWSCYEICQYPHVANQLQEIRILNANLNQG